MTEVKKRSCFSTCPFLNELGKDSKRRGLSGYGYYLTFLKEALEGKEPGLGNSVLTHEHPSQEVLDIFRTPIGGHQNYTIVVIDARAFENGGTLTIDIEVGREDSDGTFYLLKGDTEFPTEGGVLYEDVLAAVWNEPGETGQITYRFDRGQFFKLGAIGYSHEAEESVNAFHAKISVEVAD